MQLKNQRGQLALEAVLLMTVILSATLFGIKALKDNDVLSKLVESPWERTSGMIENGIWGPPAANRKKVPYSFSRFYTPLQQ